MEQPIHAETSRRIEVEEHLIEATPELFDAYGICLRPFVAEDPTRLNHGMMVSSTIGFAGDELWGALVISTSLDFVRRLQLQLAMGSLEPSIEAACDTLGEFSNMLLGRLKHSLLLRGATILLATPTTAVGERMTLPRPAGCPSRWLRFDGELGRLDVRLDALFSPAFGFATASSGDAHLSAGDTLMF